MRHLLQSHRCWSGVDERLCPFTHKAEIEVLDAALPRTFQVWSWGSSIVWDSLLHTSCDTQSLRIHASSIVPGKLMLLIGKDTLQVLDARDLI